LLYHSDETRSKAGFPLTVQLERSGYIVGEWFPQMHKLLTSYMWELVLEVN
jgi:hypothetical protein